MNRGHVKSTVVSLITLGGALLLGGCGQGTPSVTPTKSPARSPSVTSSSASTTTATAEREFGWFHQPLSLERTCDRLYDRINSPIAGATELIPILTSGEAVSGYDMARALDVAAELDELVELSDDSLLEPVRGMRDLYNPAFEQRQAGVTPSISVEDLWVFADRTDVACGPSYVQKAG